MQQQQQQLQNRGPLSSSPHLSSKQVSEIGRIGLSNDNSSNDLAHDPTLQFHPPFSSSSSPLSASIHRIPNTSQQYHQYSRNRNQMEQGQQQHLPQPSNSGPIQALASGKNSPDISRISSSSSNRSLVDLIIPNYPPTSITSTSTPNSSAAIFKNLMKPGLSSKSHIYILNPKDTGNNGSSKSNSKNNMQIPIDSSHRLFSGKQAESNFDPRRILFTPSSKRPRNIGSSSAFQNISSPDNFNQQYQHQSGSLLFRSNLIQSNATSGTNSSRLVYPLFRLFI